MWRRRASQYPLPSKWTTNVMPIRSLQAHTSPWTSCQATAGEEMEILNGGKKSIYIHLLHCFCGKDCGGGINSEDSMLNKFGKKTNPNR